MVTTRIHPHPVSKWKTLTVVAMDLTGVTVHYVPGTADIADAGGPSRGPLGVTPGLIDSDHLDDLLVVHNGGFQPRHGHWGMRVGPVEVVPPKPTGCTIALFVDGRIHIRTFTELSSKLTGLRAYRQTPPCLVEEGQVHPRLVAHDDRPWGGHNPKDKTRRRSAMGISEHGAILFYGMGEELEPSELAQGMLFAGARHAAQLDINWSWTRFLLYGRPGPGAELQVTSTLIPQMVSERRGYTSRPAARDFFYILRSHGGQE